MYSKNEISPKIEPFELGAEFVFLVSFGNNILAKVKSWFEIES